MTTPIQMQQPSNAARQRVEKSFGRQGMVTHLGARLTHIALPAQPEACWQDGCIHDGVGSAIADNAGGHAARTLCGEESEILTVEIKINPIAPVVGDHSGAIDTVLKPGRT
ncbi:DUF4442 domain-containing protein [Streptomyces sp. NPDC005722]